MHLSSSPPGSTIVSISNTMSGSPLGGAMYPPSRGSGGDGRGCSGSKPGTAGPSGGVPSIDGEDPPAETLPACETDPPNDPPDAPVFGAGPSPALPPDIDVALVAEGGLVPAGCPNP